MTIFEYFVHGGANNSKVVTNIKWNDRRLLLSNCFATNQWVIKQDSILESPT